MRPLLGQYGYRLPAASVVSTKLTQILLIGSVSFVAWCLIQVMSSQNLPIISLNSGPALWFLIGPFAMSQATLVGAARKGKELLGLDIISIMMTLISVLGMGILFTNVVDTNVVLAAKCGFLLTLNIPVLSQAIGQIWGNPLSVKNWIPKAPQLRSNIRSHPSGFRGFSRLADNHLQNYSSSKHS